MKAIEKFYKIVIYFYLPFSLFFFGCKNNNNRKLLESYLNFQFPDYASHFQYSKVSRSYDNDRPFEIFGKFKIKQTGYHKICKDIGLVNSKSDFKKQMCFGEFNNSYLNRFWDIDFGNHNKKKIKWWESNLDSKAIIYGAFYKIKGKSRIEKCYQKPWDGKIIFIYDHKTETAYIYISVLMN